MNAESKKTPHDRIVDAAILARENPTPVVELGIPMRDGIELAADVYFPLASSLPAPVILTMTPYDKAGIFNGTEAKFYQANGYIFVAVDCRGRGKSEGEWRAFVNDGADGHDAVEWLARQTWCTGKVGTTGLSYAGWFQWATAAELPEHLVAMVSTSAAGRWMREIPYTDGCFQLYFGWWTYMVRRRIIERYGLQAYDWQEVLRLLPLEKIGELIDPTGETWRDLMDHDTLDDFWKSMRFDARYAEMNYPCLHVTGWYDLEDLLGAFHHYEGMVAASPAKANQFLIAGPWSHGGSRNPHHSYAGVYLGEAAAVEMDHVHLRWFDYWLRGIDNGLLREPRVNLWRGGINEWIETDHWPLAERETSYFLQFDGEMSSLSINAAEAPGEIQRYRYDPLDPAPTRIDINNYMIEEVPIVMNDVEERADVLVYTSDPMTEEVEISGWPHLELFAASDRDDTEWHIKLTDVDQDGRSVKVCQGCMRASYRNSNESPEPLEPGQVARFDIELWPVDHVFQPGHQLRVTITSSDFPWFARSLNQFGSMKNQSEPKAAINSVYHGAPHASRIVLPVRHGNLPGA